MIQIHRWGDGETDRWIELDRWIEGDGEMERERESHLPIFSLWASS